MNQCYEEFSSCMERSAIDTANTVFVGDEASQEYRGYVLIGICISDIPVYSLSGFRGT